MKAALCKSLDGPEGVVIEDIAEPVAGPGEVLIKVRAAALNFFDTLITRGKYQTKPELPFSPSGEVAGVVESIGTGVSGLKPGDRVAAYVGYGGAREKVAVPAAAVVPIPAGVGDDIASGISITYGTADSWPQGSRRGQGGRDGRRTRRLGRRWAGRHRDRQAHGRSRHRRGVVGR